MSKSKPDNAIDTYPGYSNGEWRNRFTTGVIEWKDPADLLASPNNHRIHERLQQEQVETLLNTFGWLQAVLVSHATDTVVDGHLRIILAIRHNTQVPVLYLDLSEAEERAALTSLDYTASKAGIDLNILATNVEFMQVEFPALEVVWENFKLDFELNGNGHELPEEPPDVDETEAERLAKEYGVQVGDVWKLGRHTIACIDCLDAEKVAEIVAGVKIRMVFADPPYGIEILGKRERLGLSKVYAPVIGDNSTSTARAALRQYGEIPSLQIWWGANYYADALPPSACWIIWDKDHHGMTFADAELAWVNDDSPMRCFRHAWSGADRDSEKGVARYHPTQKPVALADYVFREYGKAGDVILDPFLGSGITVLAAESLGDRTVIGFELSPAYIGVVIHRWQKLTGTQAERVTRLPRP